MKRFLLIIATVFASLTTFAIPDEAENFTLTDIDGVTHNLYTYLGEGKYVVIDFFFTTCHYCQEAIPEINEIYRGMGCNTAGTIVLGIESTTSDEDTRAFREEFGSLYPLISGDAGGAALADAWGIEGFPTVVVIKPDHTVVELEGFSVSNVAALGAQPSACEDNWPVADFEGDPLILPAGESVTFTDLSTGAPFSSWQWRFNGGTPMSAEGKVPGAIVYNTPGEYDVTLTVTNTMGNEASTTKRQYIKVIEPATEPPVAYFSSNRVIVLVGNTVEFTDLSTGNPYIWNWQFEGATPATSTSQNPHAIRYDRVGTYNVQLIVTNTLGSDTLLMEDYIEVIPDIGDEAPVAKFTASNRLVKVNTPIYFEDQSTNYPMNWAWTFEGGDPRYTENQNIPNGVTYTHSGFYDVTLTVSNGNGSSTLQKKDYIVVYENFISSFCDTITNLDEEETAKKLSINGMDGYLGGHNSDRVSTYADFYNFHTYNEISSIIVPVLDVTAASPSSYIRFYTWDGADDKPTTVLSSQKVYLNDLRPNYFHTITFAEPLKVDGPFYLGYSINYVQGDNLIIGVAPNRGEGKKNTLWVNKGGEWKTAKQAYNINTSTGIKVMTCLVGIDDVEFENNFNIYPNPCTDKLIIGTDLEFDDKDIIEIFDQLGRSINARYIVNRNNIEVDVNNLSAGTYIVRIFTQGNVIVKKFEKME